MDSIRNGTIFIFIIMKQKTIQTDKATLLVVELPDGAEYLGTYDSKRGELIGIDYSTSQTTFKRWLCPMEVKVKFKILGRLPDITEDQWKDVVDDYDNGYFYYPDGYKDTCETATESGLSLLQAKGVCFENPLGSYPCVSGFNNHLKTSCIDSCQGACWDNADFDYHEWELAQSKVWDKERCYLLK